MNTELSTADEVVASAARRIRVLGTLTWSSEPEGRFLEAWRAGRRALPEPPSVARPSENAELIRVARRHDDSDPLSAFVGRTARSYATALAMLRGVGTDAFVAHSRALYGHPEDRPVRDGPSVLEEAEALLARSEGLDVRGDPPELDSDEAVAWLQERVDRHFVEPLPVVSDPDLGSLAAAGSRRIRLRGGVRWRRVQLEQLLQHEALVHSATKRNGRRQPLKTLGLSSPRTSATQEGLATLAELVTDALDVKRLRRIALRVRLVARALEGADFIEVFELALANGNGEREAFRTAMRVFRGGDVRGGIAFTKDVAYLAGLRRVHSFLLSALAEGRTDLVSVLFAGRMTVGDAVALAEPFSSGALVEPAVMPTWARNTDRLAAYLLWAGFSERVPIVELRSFSLR